MHPPSSRLFSLLLALLAAGLPLTAPAHDSLSHFIQHDVVLSLNATNVEVVVVLTFFEEWSERERTAMDRDGDGRLRRDEIDRHFTSASNLETAVSLAIDGHRLPLVWLYAPEADLLGETRPGGFHHRLTLHWFAPAPKVEPGSKLVLSDALWPQAPGIFSLNLIPGDGTQLEPLPFPKLTPPETALQPRRLELRCVRPPKPAETSEP